MVPVVALSGTVPSGELSYHFVCLVKEFSHGDRFQKQVPPIDPIRWCCDLTEQIRPSEPGGDEANVPLCDCVWSKFTKLNKLDVKHTRMSVLLILLLLWRGPMYKQHWLVRELTETFNGECGPTWTSCTWTHHNVFAWARANSDPQSRHIYSQIIPTFLGTQ